MPVDPSAPFVPADFVPPRGLVTAAFVLEPLGPRHNESDYAAWTSSIAHIQATPGFARRLVAARDDARRESRRSRDARARTSRKRSGFTYTVLDPDDGDVIGCLYIYPLRSDDDGDARRPIAGAASVLSWVRADRAELDVPLWRAVSAWLEADWPFEHIAYAPRA